MNGKNLICLVLLVMCFWAVPACLADAASDLAQADSHMKTLRYQQAATEYKAIVTNYPDSDHVLKAQKNLAVTYILMQKLAELQQVIDKMVTDFANNPNPPEAVYRIANRYAVAGNYQRAKKVYQRVLSQFPQTTFAQKAGFKTGDSPDLRNLKQIQHF